MNEPIHLVELQRLTAPQLVDVALETEDRTLFWLLLGMICVAFGKTRWSPGLDELWATAYVEPRGDYDKAVKLLRAWKERNPSTHAAAGADTKEKQP